MQMELLRKASDPDAKLIPESNEIAHEQTQLNVGAQFKALLKRYYSALDTYIKALQDLQDLEKNIPCKEGSSAIDLPPEYGVSRWKTEAAQRTINRMVMHAQEIFAPGAAGLEIDMRPINERFPIDRGDDWSKFDPEEFWNYLEENYGGEAGKNAAWSQAADVIFRELSLEQQEKIERKADFMVVNRQVYTSRNYHGELAMSHYTADTIRTLFAALISFASWADRTLLVADLQSYHTTVLRNWEPLVESRQRFGFGENSMEMILITYNSRWEFRFRLPIAEKLQIFLAMYQGMGSTNHE